MYEAAAGRIATAMRAVLRSEAPQARHFRRGCPSLLVARFPVAALPAWSLTTRMWACFPAAPCPRVLLQGMGVRMYGFSGEC